ncbi:MAG TPA: hypothetical protein VFC19_00065 [Candidatus Limnocylindrales bacterium]|nr:hypothetical protein [Candidatus Limnocylindrales bacterium]
MLETTTTSRQRRWLPALLAVVALAAGGFLTAGNPATARAQPTAPVVAAQEFGPKGYQAWAYVENTTSTAPRIRKHYESSPWTGASPTVSESEVAMATTVTWVFNPFLSTDPVFVSIVPAGLNAPADTDASAIHCAVQEQRITAPPSYHLKVDVTCRRLDFGAHTDTDFYILVAG